MGIFSNLNVYKSQKWNVKSVDPITDDDLQDVESVSLRAGDYGVSVCLTLRNGDHQYIPMANDSKAMASVTLDDMRAAKVVTLSRDGDKDIYRIKF